jgi:hypothetical protein
MIHDPEFEKVLRWEVDGVNPIQKVMFFDNENNVRQAIYAAEFESGSLRQVHEDLTKRGVLKAVVYVNCLFEGTPSGYGHRTTVVEYIPDQSWNTISHKPYPSLFERKPDERAVEIAQNLMKENEK